MNDGHKRSLTSLRIGKSIKAQLTVLLFCMTALSIGVVGYLGIRAVLNSGAKAEDITSNSMQQRAEQFLVQTANDTADKNGLVFKNIQLDAGHAAYYVTNVLNNPANFPNTHWSFDSHMQRTATGIYTNSISEPSAVYVENYITPTAQLKRETELLTYADYLMPNMLQHEPNAAAFYFLGTQGETVYYPNQSFGDIVPPDFNPTTLDFYTVADPQHNPKHQVAWSPVYDDPAGHGLLITASAPLYLTDGTFKGIIGMDVTLGNIAKNIEDYSPIESSYAFLIDGSGRAVALPPQGYKDILQRASKKDEFGASLQKVGGDFGAVLQKMRSGKQGFQDVNANNRQLLVAYAPVPNTTFSLAIVGERPVLLKAVGALQRQVRTTTHQVLYFQMLPFAIFLLALVWLVGFRYIRFLTTPIIALTEQTRRVMQGDFKHGVTATSSNEIGILAQAFNKMIAELATSYHALNAKVKELHDGKAKDEAILESIGEGVIVTDPQGKIVLMNDIAARLLGLPHDAVGSQVSAYKQYDSEGKLVLPEHRPIHQAITNGKKAHQNVQSVRQNGTKSLLMLTASPVRHNNAIIGAVEIVRDITKEHEIDRMKSEFISVASHQLRTPLSAIRWFSELLLKGEAGKLKTDQAQFTEKIADSASRMNELVGALLNISRLESGRMTVEPEPTDLRELVAGVATDLHAHFELRQQKLTIDIDKSLPSALLDHRLIAQVYLNLLSNASKYSRQHGKIALHIARDGHNIVSAVSDNGYGIPKAEQHKVFQKFYRGSNIVKVETDGTGLGMYLTKMIVDASGGKIFFESKEGKGTVFTFTLPLKEVAATPATVAPGANGMAKKIAVVDTPAAPGGLPKDKPRP